MKKNIRNMKDNWQVELPDQLNDIKSQLIFTSKKAAPFWRRNKLIFAPMSLIIISLFIFILVQQTLGNTKLHTDETNHKNGPVSPTEPGNEDKKTTDTTYSYDEIIADQNSNFPSNIIDTIPATFKIQTLARLSFTNPYLNVHYINKIIFNDVDVTNISMQFVNDFNYLNLKVSNDQFDIAHALKNSERLAINYYDTIYHFIFTTNNYLMIELNNCYFFYKLPTNFNIANYFTN